MSETSKGGKLVSLRVPPPLLQRYSDLLESVGLSVPDGVRLQIEETVAARDKLDLGALKVSCKFEWLDTPSPRFPELVGDLSVSVSSMPGVSDEDLAQLVFTTPEFYVDQYERFRIDSFHFQRVCSERICVESARTKRNVLSFRLIAGVWRAGIFSYPSSAHPWERESAEREIRGAVEYCVHNTVAAFLLKRTPVNRLLTQEEVASANAILLPEHRENSAA
ncbi:hypothetical protein [Paraburkholderia sp. J41]|uniref:hypothetical protein n=1 Tax=Paraburkholderia sp. J41 TaxID=2805433 RepID=UPI002AC36D1F|nr:hypothetical protein [Paraburkholderia sp. J41]